MGAGVQEKARSTFVTCCRAGTRHRQGYGVAVAEQHRGASSPGPARFIAGAGALHSLARFIAGALHRQARFITEALHNWPASSPGPGRFIAWALHRQARFIAKPASSPGRFIATWVSAALPSARATAGPPRGS